MISFSACVSFCVSLPFHLLLSLLRTRSAKTPEVERSLLSPDDLLRALIDDYLEQFRADSLDLPPSDDTVREVCLSPSHTDWRGMSSGESAAVNVF